MSLPSPFIGDARPPRFGKVEALLEKRYSILEELPAGAFARVYLAIDGGGKRVAIKTVPTESHGRTDSARFKREMKLLQRMSHPHIVRVIEAAESDDMLWIIMPYAEDGSVHRLMEKAGRLPLGRCLEILHALASALDYAHGQGVVHRDIKPANVLLDGEGIMLTDFGIAKLEHGSDHHSEMPTTDEGLYLGTLSYMPLEQLLGEKDVTFSADLHALGALGYEMLTGRLPRPGRHLFEVATAHQKRRPRDLTKIRQDAPDELAKLIMSCLSIYPSKRPESAKEVLRRIELVRLGLGTTPPLPPWYRDRNAIIPILLAVVALVTMYFIV